MLGVIRKISDFPPNVKLKDHLLVSIFCLGIMVEGFGSLLDGLMGTGNGTTSTSINVGVVGLTKVSM